MSVLSKLKNRAVDGAIALVLSHYRRRLESGDYGEVSMGAWQKVVRFMDGKKTWTGFALLAVPAVVGTLVTTATDAGVDPAVVARIAAWGTGAVLVALGLAHKLVKWLDDMTPDDKRDSL